MPKKPSVVELGLSLLNKAERGELDGLLHPVHTLFSSLALYRPAQGFETKLDREAFALQHAELRGALMGALRQILALGLIPPMEADDPEGLPTEDALEGLESWMDDIDAAVAIATHTTTAPGAPAEIASSAAPGASPGAPGAAAGVLPDPAATGEPAFSLARGGTGGES